MGILQKEDTTREAVCPLFLTGEIRPVELSLPLGCLQAFQRVLYLGSFYLRDSAVDALPIALPLRCQLMVSSLKRGILN